MSTELDAVPLFALQQIHHNHHRGYNPTTEIDPNTGEFMLVTDTQILEPDRVHDVPRELADELLALAAKQDWPCVRHPTDQELLAHRMAKGELVAR